MEQTAESFTEKLPTFRTKRDLGDLYRMNSGTWTQEMDTFEAFFAGKTAEELKTFFERQTAANGRVIRANATKEEDLAKWNALNDEEKANVDALTGATMSLSDAHGDILGALIKAIGLCKPMTVNVAAADTYTSASTTKQALQGEALAAAEAVLMAKSSLLSTIDEARAEGYVQKEGTSNAQIMSVNPDGSVGLSTISEWQYENGKACVKLTHGQNALNLATVGAAGTLLVRGDGVTYLLHLRTVDVKVLEYSEETAGQFDQHYSGADNALNEYDITFNVTMIEQSALLIF